MTKRGAQQVEEWQGWTEGRTASALAKGAAVLLVLAASGMSWAVESGPGSNTVGQGPAFPAGGNSMMAGSAMTDYTASAVIYILAIGFLVTVLLGGGFLIINLGLLSKRAGDRIGGRTPSDVGILKGTLWPAEEQGRTPVLPAEESDDEAGGEGDKRVA